VTTCEREAIITFVAAYRAGVEKNILSEAVIFFLFRRLRPHSQRKRGNRPEVSALQPWRRYAFQRSAPRRRKPIEAKGQKSENDKTVVILALPPFLSFLLHPLPSSAYTLRTPRSGFARRRLDQYRERPLAKSPLATARGTDSSPQSRSWRPWHIVIEANISERRPPAG
jgi:hypothetical protein